MSVLIVSGTIAIDPAHHAAGAAAAIAMMSETRKEAGNLAYHFSADLSERGVFYIFEKWRDQSCLDAHMEEAHMKTFRATIRELGRRDVSVLKYEIASEGPVF
jgi:quinol monooxygenase YgiN